MGQGTEPLAALPPVEPDEEVPVGEAEPGAAGVGAPIADPVAMGAGAALDLAGAGAPGGGIATIEGAAAPEGDPEPISEPSPVTVGVPESPTGALGDDPGELAEGEAPELPESAGPAGAALQEPVGGASFWLTLWTLGPGLGNSKSVAGLVSHPLPMLATNMSGKAVSRLSMSTASKSSVAVVL